jgi:hypothetical protein
VASVSLEEHNTVTQLPNECCYFSRQGFRKSDARERNGQSKAEQRALRKGADRQFLSRMMDQLVRGAATSSTAKLHGFMGVGHGGDPTSLNMEYTQCLYDTGCSFHCELDQAIFISLMTSVMSYMVDEKIQKMAKW